MVSHRIADKLHAAWEWFGWPFGSTLWSEAAKAQGAWLVGMRLKSVRGGTCRLYPGPADQAPSRHVESFFQTSPMKQLLHCLLNSPGRRIGHLS